MNLSPQDAVGVPGLDIISSQPRSRDRYSISFDDLVPSQNSVDTQSRQGDLETSLSSIDHINSGLSYHTNNININNINSNGSSQQHHHHHHHHHHEDEDRGDNNYRYEFPETEVRIIANQYGTIGQAFVYFCIFLVTFSYGLDLTIRNVYQAYATNSFARHSLLATINVINGSVSAAIHPMMARLEEKLPRHEMLIISILFYSIGTLVESQSNNVSTYAGGATLFQIGYTGLLLTLQLLIGDLTCVNSNLFCYFVPAIPFVVNTWIGGDIAQALGGDKWSWGIGMWAIIMPVMSIPLLICLLHMRYKAVKTDQWKTLKDQQNYKQDNHINLNEKGKNAADKNKDENNINNNTNLNLHSINKVVKFIVTLDPIGTILAAAIQILILVPLTISGGIIRSWSSASTIAPLVVGGCCVPVFILWETFGTDYPIVTSHLIRNRGIWAALIIAMSLNLVWYMQGDYMYTVLVISVHESVKSATRIVSLYSFVSVLVGTFISLMITKVKNVKPIITFGSFCWITSMGLLVLFRGSEHSHSGIIGALCFLGFAAGLFTYPAQASIQVSSDPDKLHTVVPIYLASFNIGAAFGSAITGAIWTELLPRQISKRLPDSLRQFAYDSPFSFIEKYTWETTERQLVVNAYKHVQKVLCITGTILCVPAIICTLFIRNHDLGPIDNDNSSHDDTQHDDSNNNINSNSNANANTNNTQTNLENNKEN